MRQLKKMRLLIATSHRGVVGGTERYLQGLIPALIERGHQLALLYDHEAVSTESRIDPLDAELPRWQVDPSDTTELTDRLEKWNPEVVYSHGLQSTRLEETLLNRYPVALYGHNYYGTCATGRKCHAYPRYIPCSRNFGPGCLVLHYPRRCGGLNPITMWRSYNLQSRRNVLLKKYRAVAVASRHMRDEFLSHDVSGDRLHLVPLPASGITPDAMPPVPRPLTGRVLLVGRLTKLKGGDYLIRAMRIASEALGRRLSLTVVGSGPDRSRLEELCRQENIEADFVGWVDTARVMSFMRSADLLAAPSLWPEPFGLVGIEAGCVGLPAVGYEVGGIPDWLTSGGSGELAPGNPPTVSGLADAISRALRDVDRHSRLRRGAWETSKRFSMDAHLETLEPILERIGPRKLSRSA